MKSLIDQLDEAVYDPSWKNIPVAQRTPRQEAAIKAYGGARPQGFKAVVWMDRGDGKYNMVLKLKARDFEAATVEGQKAGDDLVAHMNRLNPNATVKLVKVEIK